MEILLNPQIAALVFKATSEDPQPTPGYLYIELTKNVDKSQGTCQIVLDQLIGRLKKSSPFIKRKALRCMKHILNQSSSYTFRTLLQSHSDSDIRPCTTITGPPDPQYGEEPFQSVRRDATELIDLLYRQPPPTISSSSLPLSSSSSSSSSSTFSSSNASFSSGSEMNTPQSSHSGSNVVSALFGTVRNKLSSLTTSPSSSSSNFGLPPSSIPSMPSIDTNGSYSAPSSKPIPTQTQQQQSQPTYSQPQSNSAQATFINDRTEIEAEVLNESSGKDIPSSEELSNLIRKARSAPRQQALKSYQMISDALANGNNGSVRKQMRALCAVESLVNGLVFGAKDFFFSHSASSIAALSDSSNTMLQTKAMKVLAIVMKPSTSSSASSLPQSTTQSKAEENVPPVRSLVDLLQGSSHEVPALEVATPSSNTPSNNNSNESGGMFSGLETTHQEKPKQQPTSSSLIDLLGDEQKTTIPPKPTSQTTQTKPDLLGGLDIVEQPKPAKTNDSDSAFSFLAQQQPKKQQEQIQAIDALTQPTTTETSSFSFLTSNVPAVNKEQQPQPSQSAFSFLSATEPTTGTPKTTTTTTTTQTPTIQSSAFSFI